MSKLLELAERVERAEGPDSALDAAISAEVRLDAVPDWARMWAGEWRGHDDGTVHMVHADGSLGPHLKARAWTASIDAAMTLVPEGAVWLRKSPETMSIYTPPKDEKVWAAHIDAKGATPALALTSAALRARASQETEA